MLDQKQNPASEERSAVEGVVHRGVQDLAPEHINFVKAAFNWQYNWIALTGAALFAIISGSGLPLVLAAGLELIYLSLLPQSSAFRRLARSWKFAEEKRRRQMTLAAMLAELPREFRSRYDGVCQICASIRGNYARLSSTAQIFIGQMDERLNGLLMSYLRLLHSAYQHREYLRATSPEGIRRESAQLQKGLDLDAPRVQEINRRRVEILGKRLEKYQKILENQTVIDAQCAAIEDVLQLIRDQSVTLRDPQQLSDQLENLVHDVEQTEQTVQDVEAIFEMAAPEMDQPVEALPRQLEQPPGQPTNRRSRLRD
jgi:hypothetical protein